ncbi:hypothetical protein GE061_004056 [Apolygus lucorum]|uniref:Uncharacterized protein n=1 Tax=Apolygus lucorum TaxID=248454 RepID=A0A8S9WYA7_APOLU|nr:hypothetical protein GE061_004056 [Apolygus lucorum]
MEYTYECSLCDRSQISSFYVCSNCHICCFRCYSRKWQNTCELCGLGQVYCCEFLKFRLDEEHRVLFHRSTGPIVVLPLTKDHVCSTDDVGGSHFCASDATDPRRPGVGKLMRCLDCRKCVFLSRVLEHYVGEHKETLICPVPPGSMVTFQLFTRDIEIGKMKKLQLLQLMDISEETSSTEDEVTSSEGEDSNIVLTAFV